MSGIRNLPLPELLLQSLPMNLSMSLRLSRSLSMKLLFLSMNLNR